MRTQTHRRPAPLPALAMADPKQAAATPFRDARPEAVAQRRMVEAIAGNMHSPHRGPADASGGGRPAAAGGGLPDPVRVGIESLSGLAMDDVKVHYNSSRPARLGALAYAQGSEIHLAPGQERQLPHEAWHVVQQKQGRVRPTLQLRHGGPVIDDAALEQEADRMGAQALRTPAGEESLSRAGAAADAPVQRRIGFEIETGIPITEQVPNPDPLTVAATPLLNRDAHPQTMAQTVRFGSLVISADHFGAHVQTVAEPFAQWSIVEAVTDPVNDSMSIHAFDALATTWLARLIAIKQAAQAAPPAHALHGAYQVGLPSAQAYNHWDRIAPQVTVGVPLDQVGKMISAFPLSGTASAYNATALAKAAPAAAMRVMQQLVVALPPAAHDGVDSVRGLITLMTNYLTAGNDDAIARVIYMKNRPANVFYKSKLSDVRNNLVGTTYGNQVLNSVNGRAALRLLLLAETGRIAGHPLFKGDPSPHPQGVASTVTVGTWLTEVLDGTDDQIFDEMKNPWANEIDPDANDEVVIELRKQGFNLTHANFTLEDFGSGLLSYLKKVFVANKAIKNHEV